MACQADTKEGSMRKGPWLEEEDEKLASFVTLMGERRWDSIARVSGLRRSGKSCRLRWLNYLRPNLKHGQMSAEEELLILELHKQWGNKWSKIARSLPGRTDNEIKNYWRTHLRKKVQALEQEKLQKEIKDAISKVQDFLMQEGNQLSSQMDSYDYIGSCEKNTLIMTNSVNGFGSSDCSFSVSPYETRLHNCLSESSHNYGVEFKEIEESHTTLNTCICNSTWTWGGNDSMWDSHYKLEGSFF